MARAAGDEEENMKAIDVKRVENAPYDRTGKGRIYILESDFLAFVKEAESREAILQHIIDCANTPLMADVLKERDALQSRLDEAIEALKMAEWGDEHEKWNYCPVCYGRKDIGHTGTCQLNAAISKAKAVKG